MCIYMKVYKFGSCRLKYLNKRNVQKTFYMTHTLKEVIQMIKIFNGMKIKPLYEKTFDKFDTQNNKIHYLKSKLIVIELSSIKEVNDSNGVYYNTNILNQLYDIDWNNTDLTFTLSTCDSLKQDLKTIFELIDKPIIFQGHLDIGIPNRTLIDDFLMSNCKYKLILKNIYKNHNLKKVCKLRDDNKIDANHLTEHGYNLLFKQFKIFESIIIKFSVS